MTNILAEKVALITGGSSGIGRGAALKLAKNGASIALVDIKEEHAEQVAQEIRDLGAEVIVLEADVSNTEQVAACYEKTLKKWGKLDIVFANAGINGVVAPIEDLSAEDWDSTLNTNLKGTFLTVKYAIPHMKETGGSIIITSSINGNRTFKNFGMTAYSSSKAAQVAFGKMAALELAQYKIRVNTICPGAIDTNIDESTIAEEDNLAKIRIPVEYPKGNQPLKNKSGSSEEVGNLVLFLASDQSAHITGSKIYIDGAESLL